TAEPAAVEQPKQSPTVAPARERLAPWTGWHARRGRDEGKQTIIRADRLDPSKNQIIGFCAFGRLLELRPDLCRNVRFLAFLIPSRTDLSVYRNYRDAVYTMIDDREQALAAMEQCDVLLANSRVDGLNLVV